MEIMEIMEIRDILSNEILRKDLIKYCIFLSEKYNETISGFYRIKYNHLYPILFEPISDKKKEELFYLFITSLNINPIKIIEKNRIVFDDLSIYQFVDLSIYDFDI